MGFDREVTNYSCGCYYEYLSHDFFNYKKDHRFVNVCSKHPNQTAAMEDQNQREIQIATDILLEIKFKRKNSRQKKKEPNRRKNIRPRG